MTKSKVKNEKVISLPPRAPLFLVAIHVQPAVDSDHQIVVVVAESVQKSDIKKTGLKGVEMELALITMFRFLFCLI